jgi:hypothetical protein
MSEYFSNNLCFIIFSKKKKKKKILERNISFEFFLLKRDKMLKMYLNKCFPY